MSEYYGNDSLYDLPIITNNKGSTTDDESEKEYNGRSEVGE